MRRRNLVPLALMAAIVALVTPAAEAKLKASLVLEPVQPSARRPVRVTMRTEIALPRSERVRLFAVGPWRQESGQGVIDTRLARVGPRAFATNLRFPYAGRWTLQVFSVSGAILAARQASVR